MEGTTKLQEMPERKERIKLGGGEKKRPPLSEVVLTGKEPAMKWILGIKAVKG